MNRKTKPMETHKHMRPKKEKSWNENDTAKCRFLVSNKFNWIEILIILFRSDRYLCPLVTEMLRISTAYVTATINKEEEISEVGSELLSISSAG